MENKVQFRAANSIKYLKNKHNRKNHDLAENKTPKILTKAIKEHLNISVCVCLYNPAIYF